MSLSNINTQINTILSAVTGIGTKIYNYDVYSDTWSVFLNFFRNTGDTKINGWMYYRIRTPEEANACMTNIRTHTFLIRGVYSLDTNGSTLTAFQDLVELITAAFRNKPDLNGTALTVSPIQVNMIENRQFGDVLCHYAELNLIIEEEVQWTK